jgi:hypothetical protein
MSNSSEHSQADPTDTCAILSQSISISRQTNEIGAEILIGLQTQREQIDNSRRNIGLVDSALERSKDLLKSLQNNLLFNKYIGALFVSICITITGLYFYYR